MSRTERGPLNYSLSSHGIAVTGFTDNAEELIAFANRLIELAQVLPAATQESTQ